MDGMGWEAVREGVWEAREGRICVSTRVQEGEAVEAFGEEAVGEAIASAAAPSEVEAGAEDPVAPPREGPVLPATSRGTDW